MSAKKTALIIGASRGLGLGLVQRLTEQGWEVTATVRDAHKADDLKAVPGVHIQTLDLDEQSSLEVLTHNLKGQVYDLLFVKPYLAISRLLRGDPLDHTIGLIPRLVKAGNGLMSRTETGQLRWYAASIAAGAVLVLGAIVLV